METCDGPILVFPVPADGEWEHPAALEYCISCQAIAVAAAHDSRLLAD